MGLAILALNRSEQLGEPGLLQVWVQQVMQALLFLPRLPSLLQTMEGV